MNTMRGFRVAGVLTSAVMAIAVVGQAEKPMAVAQQDSGQKEKHAAELAVLARPTSDEASDGQQAQQNVVLQLVAADAQVVKGKPYSANTSTETVQTLPDGNRIAHRTVSRFYRDSEGRTRREQTFGNVNPDDSSPHEVKVFIEDPAIGTAFVLDPGSKTADKMQRTRKFLDERNAEDGGTRIMIKSDNDSETGDQSAPGPMVVKFREDRSGNPNTLAFPVPDEKRDVVKEDLGTRNIEGVDCSGTRQTITIPAGAIGNEKPISIVTETWFAPVIAAVVESTSDDPRYGKTTYQLTNVQLSEPSRSLFEPPPNFKVVAPK
jgi:hypothetical protein